MAQSMILDMLKTPQQVREEQLAKLRQRSTSQAQLLGAPVSATTALPGLLRSFAAGEMAQQGVDMNQIARRASTAAGSVAGMLGYGDAQQALSQAFVSPEERQAGQAQSIMKGLDPNDPVAMKEAAKQLAAIGLTGAATQLSERAEGIVDRLRARGLQDTAEARAAAQEVRLNQQEERKVAEELRIVQREKRDVATWMESNKDRLLSRVRNEKEERRRAAEERRKIDAAKTEKDKLDSILSLAGDKQALKDIGFSESIATVISNSENKAGFVEAISTQLTELAKLDKEGKEATAGQQEATQYLESMQNYLNLRDDPNADPKDVRAAKVKVATEGQRFGISNSPAYEKVVADSIKSTGDANLLNAEVTDLILQIESKAAEMPAGASAVTQEMLKSFFGKEDPISSIRAKYSRIKNLSILSALPPGVASDKDVALVLEGTISATANPEEMLQYLNGIAKIAQAEKEYNSALLAYFDDPANMNNPSGFAKQFQEKKIVERYDYMQQNYSDRLTEEEMRELSLDQLAFARKVSQLKTNDPNSPENMKKRLEEAKR